MESNRTSDVLSSEVLPQPRWKEKVGSMRSRGMSKIPSMRSTMRGSVSKTQNHLRTHPGPWVASAVGAGFGVGLLGRLLLHRKVHRGMPEVIVISGAC